MPTKFETVILESPFAGDIEKNLAYARAAMRDCLLRGEAPFASHALYTQPGVLSDADPAERAHGIAAGFAWREAVRCKTVVYTDLGCPVVYRSLPSWCPEALADTEKV